MIVFLFLLFILVPIISADCYISVGLQGVGIFLVLGWFHLFQVAKVSYIIKPRIQDNLLWGQNQRWQCSQRSNSVVSPAIMQAMPIFLQGNVMI